MLFSFRVPCGNRTHLSSLEGWRLKPLGQGHTQGGRGESRTHKAHRSTVFGTVAVAHRLALPFELRWQESNLHLTLNRRRLYQHRPHRNEVGAVGFEPTLSCSRSRRIPRLSYTPLIKSTQRELNPHFRHGKAAGYRYIMGAFELSKLSKIEYVAGVHRRESTIKWDQRGSNPHRSG